MWRKKQYIETLSFSAVDLGIGEIMSMHSHAIPLGAPTNIAKASFDRIGILSAGLFGGSGNTNTPTPSETAKSVLPKPEDLVSFPFRFISAAIVGGNSWKATDFRKDGVLKASLPLIDGKPIFTDHVQTADNWAGIITDPYWQEAFTAPDNTLIPAGISGNSTLDSKTQYNLIRGIAMGAIGSNSVTVKFNWEPSHKFSEINDFYDKIGTFDKEGQMITRKVNEVTAYMESSMLFAGADPFAKKLDSTGKPIQVDSTSVYFSSVSATEKADYEKEKKLEVVVNMDKELLSLSKSNTKPVPEKQESPMKNAFLLAFVQAFGKSLGLSFEVTADTDFTPAQEAEALAAFAKLGPVTTPDPVEAAKTTKIVNFANGLKFVNDKGETSAFDPNTAVGEYVVLQKAVHDTNVAAVSKLHTEKTELAATAAIGESFVTAKRTEALRLYKVTAGDKADAAGESIIANAKSDELDSLLKQYGGSADVKFKATCTKCQSSDCVEMRSSFTTPTTENETTAPSGPDFSKFESRGLFRRTPAAFEAQK